jgi:hypothetical protein
MGPILPKQDASLNLADANLVTIRPVKGQRQNGNAEVWLTHSGQPDPKSRALNSSWAGYFLKCLPTWNYMPCD